MVRCGTILTLLGTLPPDRYHVCLPKECLSRLLTLNTPSHVNSSTLSCLPFDLLLYACSLFDSPYE
uniref:Uncharacterized protein n=1 Tax=Picea glauca TaxID=3330 RepID=A0A101LWB4_PICGL|nr:hypothetical protein ABT39_MTgene1634 [Picea glauca]